MTLKDHISKEWRLWITSNIEKGVSKDYIFNILLENGFSYQAVKKEMKYEGRIAQTMPQSWKAWTQENILLGHDKNGLFKVLMMNGFSYDCIRQEMQYEPNVSLDELENPFEKENQKYVPFGELKTPISQLTKSAVKIPTMKLDIFKVVSFISEAECNYLIELIRHSLRPSELASPDKDKLFRTSSTCDLAELNDKTVKIIDSRICKLLGLEGKFSEPIQGQFYKVGQEFKPHTDFFEEAELKENGGFLGQRTFTVMIYLNKPKLGGETAFPLIDKIIKPEKGKAVIWSNLNYNFTPNYNSLHHAKKVDIGYKAILTKWFRTGHPEL